MPEYGIFIWTEESTVYVTYFFPCDTVEPVIMSVETLQNTVHPEISQEKFHPSYNLCRSFCVKSSSYHTRITFRELITKDFLIWSAERR